MTTTTNSDSLTPVASSPIQPVPVTVDSKGRVRASKEQRRLILSEFERSGMSAAGFARRSGLKYSTLAGWLQRYRRAKPKRRSHPMRLVEAVVDPPALAGDQQEVLMVELPGGVRLPIRQASQVILAADLLRALAKPC